MTAARPIFRAAYADADSGQVHYTRLLGRDESLAPVVFINPRSRSCREAAHRLACNRPSFIIDVPGFGLTSIPPEGASMQDVAAAIACVFAQERISKALLCGVHTGAKVTAALTLTRPDLVVGQILAGKSHSLIPNREARNRAMQAQVGKQMPDVILVGLESFVADDPDRRVGMSRMYEANFAFDFADAIARTERPTMILEFISDDEDTAHGRQAEALAARTRKGSWMALPEKEAMGTALYVGVDAVVRLLDAFCQECGL